MEQLTKEEARNWFLFQIERYAAHRARFLASGVQGGAMVAANRILFAADDLHRLATPEDEQEMREKASLDKAMFDFENWLG